MGDSGLRVWLSHASPPSSLPSLSNLPPPQPFLTFPSFRFLDILRSRFFDFFTFLFFFSLSLLFFLCNFLSYFSQDFYAILPPSTALYLLPLHASALRYRPFVLVYSPSFDFFTFLFFPFSSSSLYFFFPFPFISNGPVPFGITRFNSSMSSCRFWIFTFRSRQLSFFYISFVFLLIHFYIFLQASKNVPSSATLLYVLL